MATQAQLDEKARKDRLGAVPPSPIQEAVTPTQQAQQNRLFFPSSLADYATPAQRDEKSRQGQSSSSIAEFATEAQLSEKARQDQASSPFAAFATPNQLAEKPRGRPPPLPPRISSTPAPPPYSDEDAKRSELISKQWRSHDPRSSSTHSLVPSESGRGGRRTLLLVFVHGFMGNETSFQSFPAHIHNLLTITVEETHVVHTKIYPRYKSRNALEFARDDFSTWLEPHENHYTDIVLLGHSMGGLLIAEVALQKPSSPATGKPLRHRILGTINFDVPFLGMHPGVVVSGLESLFRPAPDPPGRTSSQPSTSGASTPLTSQASASSPSYAPSIASSEVSSQLSIVQSITSPNATPSNDPYFNAPFTNDVRLPERKGWNNLLHFINKHSDGLTAATKEYFMSHLEFGGAMADYPGLKARYEKIRALEDVDDLHPNNGPGYRAPVRRVRFVNYYTASTGRPKPPKLPPRETLEQTRSIEREMQDMSISRTESQSSVPIPSIHMEEYDDGTTTPQPLEVSTTPLESQMKELGESSGVHNEIQEPPEMRHINSMPIEDEEEFYDTAESPGAIKTIEDPISELQPSQSEPALPPLPPQPTEPESLDLSIYTDKDSRKIAEKEQKRIMKVYQQAIKDRESAIKDRKKLLEKREKKARQEREKQVKAEEKQRLKEEKEAMKGKGVASADPEEPLERQCSVAPSIAPSETPSTSTKDDKPKRDKKFCMLPPEYGGQRDKCWVRVYMEGVDEVGAHCGLFFQGPQYESLVGDVGARIEKWVKEDAAKRAVLGRE